METFAKEWDISIPGTPVSYSESNILPSFWSHTKSIRKWEKSSKERESQKLKLKTLYDQLMQKRLSRKVEAWKKKLISLNGALRMSPCQLEQSPQIKQFLKDKVSYNSIKERDQKKFLNKQWKRNLVSLQEQISHAYGESKSGYVSKYLTFVTEDCDCSDCQSNLSSHWSTI